MHFEESWLYNAFFKKELLSTLLIKLFLSDLKNFPTLNHLFILFFTGVKMNSNDIALDALATFIRYHAGKSKNSSIIEQGKKLIKKLEEIQFSYIPLASNLTPPEFYFLLDLINQDISVKHRGYTFLHALSLNTLFPQLLLDAIHKDTINLKIDCDFEREPFGNTPLHLLIANELTKTSIDFISMANKKNIPIDYSVQDDQGKTTLILAAKTRSSMIVSAIIDDIVLHKCQKNINIQDNDGNTALHYSMLLGDVISAKKLLSAGANKEIKNNKRLTPLDCLNPIHNAFIEPILKSVSIDCERDEKALTNCIRTPYYTSVFDLHQSFDDIPAQKSKSVYDQIDQIGQLNLIDIKKLFCNNESLFMTKVEKEWFINLYNDFSGISLKDACLSGKNLLRRDYCSSNQIEVNSVELRRCAAKGNLKEMIRLLNDKNINIDGQSSNGNTALHWAACFNHLECYNYLISQKASVDILNRAHKKASDLLVVKENNASLFPK